MTPTPTPIRFVPPHIQPLVERFVPNSEWMKVGDTTGDWYVPECINDDGTLDMVRVCLRLGIFVVEIHVDPRELVPLVTH